MTFSAILFDCDGVLVDSEIVGLEDTTAFLNSKGFDWGPEELIRRFTGMRMDGFAGVLREAYDNVLGRIATDAEFEGLRDGMLEARRANRHKMKIVPQALMSVQVAHATGLPLAVASSSAQVHLDSKIDRYGFAPFFNGHVYSADHVRKGKPAPDIFLYAAEKLEVPPVNCLVVEDSAHGVTAGVGAGATVWGFLGGGHILADHAEQLTAAGAERLISDHEMLSQSLRVL